MICPKCEERHAPFSKNDFEFISGMGFIAKNSEAEFRRSTVFDSDNHECCLTCIEEAKREK